MKETGPLQGTVGEKVIYSIFIANRGHEPLTGVKVVVHAEAGLYVTDASPGSHRENGDVVLLIPKLPPGETELAIEYQVPASGPAAVQSRQRDLPGGRPRQRRRACIEVRERPGAATPDLRVTMSGLYQQITAGKELTYEIRVKNQGLEPVPSGAGGHGAGRHGAGSLKHRRTDEIHRREPGRAFRAHAQRTDGRDGDLPHPRADPSNRGASTSASM